MRWFDLLEVRQVPTSVSSLVPAWRLAVLLDEMDHERVRLILDEFEARGEVVPTTWWRLVAVHGLEQQPGSAGRLLADRAIAALAARNALDHLYDRLVFDPAAETVDTMTIRVDIRSPLS